MTKGEAAEARRESDAAAADLLPWTAAFCGPTATILDCSVPEPARSSPGLSSVELCFFLLSLSSQCCFEMFCRSLQAQLNIMDPIKPPSFLPHFAPPLPMPCPLSRTQWAAQDYLCTLPTVSSLEDEELVSTCPCVLHT